MFDVLRIVYFAEAPDEQASGLGAKYEAPPILDSCGFVRGDPRIASKHCEVLPIEATATCES
jgi:hypothetical protein